MIPQLSIFTLEFLNLSPSSYFIYHSFSIFPPGVYSLKAEKISYFIIPSIQVNQFETREDATTNSGIYNKHRWTLNNLEISFRTT
ncbi:hypothetical protein VIGAN_01397400, partial [Vigna angularis var. angularis]